MYLPKEEILKACSFKTSRSSGKGGQHVNKVETRVELLFPLDDSEILTEPQLKRIKSYAGNKVDQEGILHLSSEETRSQQRNKEICQEKLLKLISAALKPQKKRKPTAPTKASKEKRLQVKKARGEVKSNRKKLF